VAGSGPFHNNRAGKSSSGGGVRATGGRIMAVAASGPASMLATMDIPPQRDENSSTRPSSMTA